MLNSSFCEPRIRIVTFHVVVCGLVPGSTFEVRDCASTPVAERFAVTSAGTMVVPLFVMRPDNQNVRAPEPGVPSAFKNVCCKFADEKATIVFP
jgi:hypothetical protein